MIINFPERRAVSAIEGPIEVSFIVPSRYFCGVSFCFMFWGLKYFCAVGALCMFAYF